MKIYKAAFTAMLFASGSGGAQQALDVRGSAPFRTTLEGRAYPEYGQIHFSCDAGQCTIQKVSTLCDRPSATLAQAVVTSDRIRLLQTPTGSVPVLRLGVEDFGTDYSCSVSVRPSVNPAGTWHVESYVCSYKSSWHGGRKKSEQSVRSLAINKACPGLVLEQSPW